MGLEFDDVRIETDDAVPLSGWLIEPPQPRGTVALFHGMRQNREQMLSRIQFLSEAGYRCIAVDHRAHGESGGKRISCGWYEAKDVKAVASWIAANYPDQPRFALGISMGAAAICFAGPDCGWKSVILEGAYADLTTAFNRRLGQCYPPWFRQLAPGILWITEKRLKLRMSDIRPVEAVSRMNSIRVLTVTGDLDSLAPPGDSMAISAAASGEAKCVVIAGAGHGDACEMGNTTFRSAILRF
jgi:pimeloyl-ACP methyl ester carboxylesterase